MYATNYTHVSIRAVYQMPHTESLTESLTRPVESTLEGNNCIAVFAMNQAEAAAGAQFTTERQRRRWGHFRKLALSTDKFILNVISRR